MSIPTTLRTRFNRVEAVHDRMERLLALSDEQLVHRADSVSRWSVAQQLMHSALAATSMLLAVDRIVHQAKPAASGGGLTMAGRYVLYTGHIPRGKGKAPERVVPPDNPGRIGTTEAIASTRSAVARVKGELPRVAEATWKVEHPYFGWLSAEQWLLLVRIHSEHHFKIIDDILAA